MRTVKRGINAVATIADVVTDWRPREMPGNLAFDHKRGLLIADLDKAYAAHLSSIIGPLAHLHTEKRRQAEAGGGPLVADAEDRLAILANAARQDEAIAEIERARREEKAKIRAMTTLEEIEGYQISRPGDKDLFSRSN
jgi:MoxR-like ATPase